MMLLMSAFEAQQKIRMHVRQQRLQCRLTQRALANRSGVPLATVRKFEQTGHISLASFLKMQMVLGGLEQVVASTKSDAKAFKNINDVLNHRPMVANKQGRSKHQ